MDGKLSFPSVVPSDEHTKLIRAVIYGAVPQAGRRQESRHQHGCRGPAPPRHTLARLEHHGGDVVVKSLTLSVVCAILFGLGRDMTRTPHPQRVEPP